MKKYFININGNNLGPYSPEELHMMRIQSTTPVWYQGLPAWKTAGEIPELRSLFSYGIPAFTQPGISNPYPANDIPQKSKRKFLAAIIGIALILIAGSILYCVYSALDDETSNHHLTYHDDATKDHYTDPILPPPTATDADVAPVQEAQAPDAVTYPDVVAEFHGGQAAMNEFIQRTITYPQMAKEAGIEGTVYINFTIDAKGNVTNPRLLRGVSPELDKEAMRVIAKMPPWKPAEYNGTKISSTFNLPIHFKLQ